MGRPGRHFTPVAALVAIALLMGCGGDSSESARTDIISDPLKVGAGTSTPGSNAEDPTPPEARPAKAKEPKKLGLKAKEGRRENASGKQDQGQLPDDLEELEDLVSQFADEGGRLPTSGRELDEMLERIEAQQRQSPPPLP